jgi:hypothetical protein
MKSLTILKVVLDGHFGNRELGRLHQKGMVIVLDGVDKEAVNVHLKDNVANAICKSS